MLILMQVVQWPAAAAKSRRDSGAGRRRASYKPRLEAFESRDLLAQIVGIAGGDGGDWGAGATWNTGQPPTNMDDVSIPAGTRANVILVNGVAKTLNVAGTLYLEKTLSVAGAATNSGLTKVENGGKLIATGGATNSGTMQIYNGGKVQGVPTLANSGTLRLYGGSTVEFPTVSNTYFIWVHSGTSTITGDLTNSNLIDFPDFPGAGTLSISGNFTQTGGKIGMLQLTTTTLSGLVNVGGAATLAGSLEISNVFALEVPPGNSFTPLTYGSRAGNLAPGAWKLKATNSRTWLPDYKQTQLVLYVPKMQGAANNINGVEPVAFNGEVATFTDPGRPDAVPGNYTATIVWGDGTTTSGTVQIGAGDERTVIGSHTYVDDDPTGTPEDTYPMTITIEDSGEVLELEAEAIIANDAPHDLAFELSDYDLNEGDTVTLTGYFADLGMEDTHVVEIDWGDNSPLTVLALPLGARAFTTTHTYLDEYPIGQRPPFGQPTQNANTMPLTVTVRDDDAGVGVDTDQVTVCKVVPTASMSNVQVTGLSVSFSVTYDDAGPIDTFWIGVAWGDGMEDWVLEDGERGTINVSHAYAAAGTYTVMVFVYDNDYWYGYALLTVSVITDG